MKNKNISEDAGYSATVAGDDKRGKLPGILVKYLLPLVLTVFLVWYMFTKVSFSEVMGILKNGVNLWWILLAMGISVFSHIFRAMRWGLQLRGLGICPAFMALCCSIFGTYALNLVFPRFGEVWRCAYISQREKAPFSTVLGSMVADRLADTFSVLAITILTFVVASSAMTSFLAKYPVGEGFLQMIYNPWFWFAAVLVIIVMWGVLRIAGNTAFVIKIKGILYELWKGFAVVGTMRGRGKFIILTICIWTCYFLQLYAAFFAFPFTSRLCEDQSLAFGLTPCLVAFVLSSIGMAIPSNGGLGPWNIAVVFGLAIYGISDSEGIPFSILVWSAQTVMLIILGIFTMFYISYSRKKSSAPATPSIAVDKDTSGK